MKIEHDVPVGQSTMAQRPDASFLDTNAGSGTTAASVIIGEACHPVDLQASPVKDAMTNSNDLVDRLRTNTMEEIPNCKCLAGGQCDLYKGTGSWEVRDWVTAFGSHSIT